MSLHDMTDPTLRPERTGVDGNLADPL